MEPVCFTLGIFKSAVRRTAAAWRTIGYIMNQSEMDYKDGTSKMIDYHFVLGEILKEFKQIQKEHLVWDFVVEDKTKVWKECLFPILKVIGDSEGHDKLVCRKIGYTQSHITFCRHCACPRDETDNPNYKYKYLTSNEIEKAVKLEDTETLKRIGHYHFLSAFHDCEFCDPVR